MARVKQNAVQTSPPDAKPNLPLAPTWPSYMGTSQFVGVSPSGRVTVFFDPSLGHPGFENARDLVNDADRIVAANDALFGTTGGEVSVIVFALSGRTDGTGGANHMGCDYATGAAIEVCASFASSTRVSALFAAMLSECSSGGNLCGTSVGEALSRWCAAVISNNALADFATAPQWAQDGMPPFVDQTDSSDLNVDSTGCGMAFLSWLMSQGHSLSNIAQALVSLGDTATLAQLYAKLSSDSESNAWPKFTSAVNTLQNGVTTDDPFGALPATPPSRRTLGIGPLTRNTPSAADISRDTSEVVQTVQRLEQRFDSILSEPKLDNFNGTASIRLTNEAGKELQREPSRSGPPCFLASARQPCRLEITFSSGKSRAESKGVLYLDLQISKGKPASQVTFDVFLDGQIELVKDRASVTFDPKGSSAPLVFNFTAPTSRGKHALFVEISQKNRLLQSRMIRIRVGTAHK
jgi:hypothetical protein